MKVALISDIHGNVAALKSILKDIENEKANKVFCLGDSYINGPNPKEVFKILKENAIESVRGNTEDFIIDANRSNRNSESYLKLKDSIRPSVGWCSEIFSNEEIEGLSRLPIDIIYKLDEYYQLHVFHASPGDNRGILKENSEDTVFDTIIQHHQSQIFAGGHTHNTYVKRYKGRIFLNAGCSGICMERMDVEQGMILYPGTEYMLIETDGKGAIEIRYKRIRIDLAELIFEVDNSGMPLKEKRMEMLMNINTK